LISQTQRRSADRNFRGHALHLFQAEPHKEIIAAKTGAAGCCQLPSFV